MGSLFYYYTNYSFEAIYVNKIFNPDKNTFIVHLFKVHLVGVWVPLPPFSLINSTKSCS